MKARKLDKLDLLRRRLGNRYYKRMLQKIRFSLRMKCPRVGRFRVDPQTAKRV